MNKSDLSLLIERIVSEVIAEKMGLGKNFDAWADLETNGAHSKAIKRDKLSVNKIIDDSPVPDFYFEYGSNAPIQNVNGYTQNQINKNNKLLRLHSVGRAGIDF